MKNYERSFDGETIKRILDEQGRRQDWLAAQLGVTPATVNRWLKGNRRIDLASAQEIAKVLTVPLFLLENIPNGTSIVHEGAAA